jgi:hypothetical protein
VFSSGTALFELSFLAPLAYTCQVFLEKPFQLSNLIEGTHDSYLDLQLKRTLYKLTEHHLKTSGSLGANANA